MKPGCSLIAYLKAKPEKRDELLKIFSVSSDRRARKRLASTIICTSATTIRTCSSSMKTGARARSSTSTCKRQC